MLSQAIGRLLVILLLCERANARTAMGFLSIIFPLGCFTVELPCPKRFYASFPVWLHLQQRLILFVQLTRIFYPLNAMKFTLLFATGMFALFLIAPSLYAQLPYNQTFKGSAASELVMSGNARLTAASGIDPEGDGYLRLTDAVTNQVGYAYAKDAFPSNYGLTTTFEFFTYKSTANGANQADGICFFLFDASVNAFRPGGLGGSLGYAAYFGTPGMSKGYLGIGIDEFGNFSNPSQGRNGGRGFKAGSVVVRGPGNGKTATDYVYISGVPTDSSEFNMPITKFTQRYPDYTSPNYRRIKIILTPGSSLGADKGFTITVTLFKGGVPSGTEATLINNFDYPYVAPAKLQYGFAASTGSNTDFHEIRNLTIVPTISGTLLAPTVADDSVAVCQGPKALLDVTANDYSNNAAGTINKAAVDLDPATAGVQNLYTDAGKGTYTVDQNGILTFTAVNGFIGTSIIGYTATDNYGQTSPAANIKVTVSSLLGPSLTVTDPAGACAPSTVDITNSALRSNTSSGATYNYFSSLSNANNNTGNINASASALSGSGLYFIRADLGGCFSVQPVTVVVSQSPTVSNAGAAQKLCNPGGSTLTANDPLVGTGVWSQVSGPSTATFTTPAFSNCAISNLLKGSYQFRWTISNGACAASTNDVSVTVANASAAGSNQALPNTSASTTLQANDPSPGTGAWSQVSGPTAVINTPSSYQSTVSGLVSGNTYTFKWTITNGCSTSSQMNVTVTATLPVHFLSFNGERTKEGVSLKWRVASETGNDRCVVEKSTDGRLFEAIGDVAGGGSGEAAYTYLDKQDNIQGTVYYRIKGVAKNGEVTLSSVVKIAPGEGTQQGFAVWPNPCSDKVNVTAKFASNGMATLRLYDASGSLLKQHQQFVRAGENNFIMSLPEKAPKGVYVLELKKGEEKLQREIVRE